MRKITRAHIVLAALIAVALGTANADRVFKYPRIQQEKDNWCWNACSQWILGFHGVVLSQSDICKYGFTDGVVRDQWNWIYCSTEAGSRIISADYTQFPPKFDTCFGRGINQIIKHFGVPYKIKNGSNAEYVLTENEFSDEIENGHPFVVRYNWDNGGGHFVVAMGYQNQLCWLMNPWKDDGIQIYNYQWVRDNRNGPLTHHAWDYSLQTTRIDTVPELTTVFPSIIAPGTDVSLALTSRLNGRDVTSCTFFTSLTPGVQIDSATRAISWTQTEQGPASVTFAREFGNARDTIVKTFLQTAINGLSAGNTPFAATVQRAGGAYTVNIVVPSAAGQAATIQVFAANGARILVKQIVGAGEHTVAFSRSSFAPGVYLIMISQEQYLVTEKLVF